MPPMQKQKVRNLPFEDYIHPPEVYQSPSVTLCLQNINKNQFAGILSTASSEVYDISWGQFHPLTHKGQPRLQEKEQFFFLKTHWQTFWSWFILSGLPLTLHVQPPQKEGLNPIKEEAVSFPCPQMPERLGHTEMFVISQGNSGAVRGVRRELVTHSCDQQ